MLSASSICFCAVANEAIVEGKKISGKAEGNDQIVKLDKGDVAIETKFGKGSSAYNLSNAELVDKINKEAAEKQTEKSTKPEFIISGFAGFSTNISNPNVTYYSGDHAGQDAPKDTSMARAVGGEAEIDFEARDKLSNGWKYGAKLCMYAHKKDTGIDKMYLFFERDNVGTIYAGNVKGPDQSMLCGGQQLLGGGAGLDGVVPHDIDFSTGLISPLNMVGVSGKATKVVYYSPKIFGFQAGIGITPDTKHVGHQDKDWTAGNSSNGNDCGIYIPGTKEKQRPSGRNNIGLGLKNEHKFSDTLSTKIGVFYTWENTQDINLNLIRDGKVDSNSTAVKLRNASSYQTTASIKYKDFTLGCGYLNNGKSRMPVANTYTNDTLIPGGFMSNKDGNAGQAWNVGARYNYQKWIFSTVYHNMQRKITKDDKVTGHAISVAADYIICAGLKVYAEVDYITSKSCDVACNMYSLAHRNNDSSVGTKSIKKQDAGMITIGAEVSF